MINRSCGLAALLMCLASPAFAEADDRLVDHAYDPKEVVRIDGKAGVQATIAFGQNEAIENVAVGDSQKWQITPNKRADLLFVKPLDSIARTNMTVVTNKRTYFFDLVASAKAKPLYMLRFTYKDDPKAAPAAAPASAGLATLDPGERAVVEGDVAGAPADTSTLNFAWRRSGDTKLQPSRIYDDGLSTFLIWPERTAVPAILMLNAKGEEGPVNYAVRGNTIVIDDVPDQLVLRSGRSIARLVNDRRAPTGPGALPAAALATKRPMPSSAVAPAPVSPMEN
ncbi:TrbG/VirB9 family P-type conjugative transfer protein [Novosphingobium colocasiae]|uniref:TrbG/VirB9 family P-type conjugative transfer protein n=1 Tax=Novosphingobium colocasiae TaxID=1256513 RepID=UPI0035B4F159